jgi:hypothetical protein
MAADSPTTVYVGCRTSRAAPRTHDQSRWGCAPRWRPTASARDSYKILAGTTYPQRWVQAEQDRLNAFQRGRMMMTPPAQAPTHETARIIGSPKQGGDP